MNKFLILSAVFFVAVCTCTFADAAQNLNITDSSGSVVLERVDEDSIPRLVELLDSGDYQVWKQAQNALVSFGGESVPELLKAVEKEPPSFRAIGTLGYIKDDRAVEPLSRLIASSDGEIANAARGALFSIGEPAVQTLAGLLGSEDYAGPAAEILKGIKPSRDAVEELRPLLSSDDPGEKAWAAYVLGFWRDEGSLEKIKALLGDEDATVREKAVMAYRMIAKEYDIDLLLRLADDKSGFVRREAMAMLARQPSPRVVEPMLKIMKDSQDPKDVAAAMAAAGYTKDPRLVGPMIKALEDRDDLVVGEAVYFLGMQDAASARPSIISLFRKRHEFKDPMVVQNACEALVNFGGSMEPADLHLFLGYLLKGNNYDTKYGVLDLLEKFAVKDDEETVAALEKYLSSETNQVLKKRARTILAGLE